MNLEVTVGHVSLSICDWELLKAGKKIAVCSLALVLGATADANPLLSDSSDIARQLSLQEVQVTATAQLSSTARPVIVINHEQIASLPIHSAADVLRLIPSLDIRQRGATGVQADISLRGSTPDQIVIMLNGINLTDVQTGHYSLDIPLTGDEIERVEVYASTATGLGAYAGVINIVTRKSVAPADSADSHTTAELSLKAGEYGLFAPSAAVYHQAGNLLSSTSAGYNQSTGFADNTDYKIASAFTHLEYKNLLQWQAGLQYKDAGANVFYALAYPNQFDATRTALTSLAYRQVFVNSLSLEADISYRVHYDRFELFRSMTDAPAWYGGHNRHTTHHANADIKFSYIHSWGTTTIGATAQDAAIVSNTLGNHNRFTVNYFAQQSVQLDRFSATLLAGGTYNSAFGSDWSVAADINYSPVRKLMLFANASRALRLPTFTDLYYQSKTQVANPDLKPEQAIKAEIGLRFNSGGWSASASAFYRYGINTIDWVKPFDAKDELWYSKQLTQIHTAGASAEAAYMPSEPLWHFLKQVRLAYSYIYMNKPSGDYLSKYALDYLRHFASLTIDHCIYGGVGASWQLSLRDRNGSYIDREGNTTDYQPVLLLDGKIYYVYSWNKNQASACSKSLKVELECTNMTNRQYYDVGGVLCPRHWVRAGISLTL